MDFVRCEPSQMVASYTSSNTYIYDIETSQKVLMLDTKAAEGKGETGAIYFISSLYKLHILNKFSKICVIKATVFFQNMARALIIFKWHQTRR